MAILSKEEVGRMVIMIGIGVVILVVTAIYYLVTEVL